MNPHPRKIDQESHVMSELVKLLRGVNPHVDTMVPVSTLLFLQHVLPSSANGHFQFSCHARAKRIGLGYNIRAFPHFERMRVAGGTPSSCSLKR